MILQFYYKMQELGVWGSSSPLLRHVGKHRRNLTEKEQQRQERCYDELDPRFPLPLWCAGEGTATVRAGWGDFRQGWYSAPCHHVTFTFSPIHALPCQQGGNFSSLLVFLTGCASFLETRTSVFTMFGCVPSITHLLSAFRGKVVGKTTRIQALLSFTSWNSILSVGSVSAFTLRLYAISRIMANSCFESLTDCYIICAQADRISQGEEMSVVSRACWM